MGGCSGRLCRGDLGGWSGAGYLTPAALLPLAAAACYALTGVTARMMDGRSADRFDQPLFIGPRSHRSTFACRADNGLFAAQRHGDLIWIGGMGAFGGTAVCC